MALRALLARWAQRRAALLQERVGAFFVATGYAVIAGVAFVHFSSLVPRAAPSGGGERLAHYYVSGFLLLELLLQYSLAVWSDPGVVRPEHVEGGDGEGLEEQQWAFCKKCARVKPPRAHHCRVCRRCVFEMDHHCPWVNNCVGYRNYRHFWLLLLYLWVSCAYVATLALRPFLDVMGDVKGTAERTTAERIDRFAFTFAFLTSATLGVALCAYWLWHSYLVLTRQTTIEFAMNSSDRRRTLHNKGPIDALQRLLGRRDPSWVLAVVIPPQPRTLPPPYCKRYALGSSV